MISPNPAHLGGGSKRVGSDFWFLGLNCAQTRPNNHWVTGRKRVDPARLHPEHWGTAGLLVPGQGKAWVPGAMAGWFCRGWLLGTGRPVFPLSSPLFGTVSWKVWYWAYYFDPWQGSAGAVLGAWPVILSTTGKNRSKNSKNQSIKFQQVSSFRMRKISQMSTIPRFSILPHGLVLYQVWIDSSFSLYAVTLYFLFQFM